MEMEDLFEKLPKLTEKQLKEINDCFTTYIFYKRVKLKTVGIAGVSETVRAYECTCTCCNKSYIHRFEGEPRHNDRVVCPECGANATLKHVSYGKKRLSETREVVLFCPENKNSVWMRAYYAYKTYNGDPRGNKMLNSLYTKSDEILTPDVDLSETARYFLTPGKARCFKFKYSYYEPNKWYETAPREPFTIYIGKDCGYYLLSSDTLDNTFLRYLDLNAYIDAACNFYNCYCYWRRTNAYKARFICDFAEHPIIESLLKAGFGELVADRVINRAPHKRLLNWDAQKLSDFFKTLNKKEIAMLREEDYQLVFLKAYSEYQKTVKKIDVGELRCFLKAYGLEDFMNLCRIVRNHKLNFTKATNYLKKQSPKNEIAAIQLWKDYLSFAYTLKYDLKSDIVIYPKKLRNAHDLAAKNVTALVKEKEAKEMEQLTLDLIEKYAFEYNGLKIVVPETMQDIIDEGKALCHCVGGYAERHAKGKLAILFIRKSSDPDTPYVTMEVHNKIIMQYHGYKNDVKKPLPPNVHDFVKEFSAYIDNPAAYKKAKEKKSA